MATQGPSIEGTYRLVDRELPDGTRQRPPRVFGIHTCTKMHRHTSVGWHDADGKLYAETYLARYELHGSTYSETLLLLTVIDQIGGRPASHEAAGSTAESTVVVEDGLIRFDAPQPFEKAFSLRFEYQGDDFRAIAPGVFIDHWEKIA